MNIKREDYIKASLMRHSRLQKIDESGLVIIKFDCNLYPFVEAISSLLAKNEFMEENTTLEKLHLNLKENDMDVDLFGFNKITRSTYDSGQELKILYMQFMCDLIVPFIGKDSYIQKTPTNRFSFPLSKGVNERFYHNDLMLGHPPEEINVWVPFTDTAKSKSFKILSLNKSIDLLEKYNFELADLEKAILTDDSLYSFINKNSNYVELDVGEALLFDSRCLHGVRKNYSNFSRASMDVRLLPVEDYVNLPFEYKGSKGTKRQSHFIPGDYYLNDPIRVT